MPMVNSMKLWHTKLGHLNHAVINTIGVLGNLKKDEDKICEVCVQGKMHRASFPLSSTNRTSRPLELVHADVMRPFPPSKGGATLDVTFVDDYSRFTVVRTMMSKTEVLQKFKEYKAVQEALTKQKLANVRSDCGTEYCNADFESYLAENCIGIRRAFLTVINNMERRKG